MVMTTVSDILAKKGTAVASIGRDSTVLDAAHAMNERRIGALVVTEGDSVVGIFTERDVLTRVVAPQRDPATTRVAEVMTASVACCRPDTRLEECRTVMTDRRIRHLPVVDEGRLVGIITSGDVLASEMAAKNETIEYLHAYVHGPTMDR
jgi:CBS domain-containing protein